MKKLFSEHKESARPFFNLIDEEKQTERRKHNEF